MPQWPSRDAFAEQRFDTASNALAMTELAINMKSAIMEGRLSDFAELCRVEPAAAFLKLEDETDEYKKSPADALDFKDSSFAFDAGLAWAVAAGERLGDPLRSEGFKAYAQERFEWNEATRRAALAFVSGAMQAPMMPETISQWIFEHGEKALWGQSVFGAAEFCIWGKAWEARAKKTGSAPEWCALLLSQVVRLRCDGSPREAQILADAAKDLGEPAPGWLSAAREKREQRLELRRESIQEQLNELKGWSKAREASHEALARWMAEWDAKAIALCFEGPESWARAPLSQGASPELRARFEKASLLAATPEGLSAPKPGPLRV